MLVVECFLSVQGRKARTKSGEFSPREERVPMKSGERGASNANGLLSPALSSLREEWEKQRAAGSLNLRCSTTTRLNLKATWIKP